MNEDSMAQNRVIKLIQRYLGYWRESGDERFKENADRYLTDLWESDAKRTANKLAKKFAASSHHAEDLVAELSLHFVRKIEAYKPSSSSSFGAWWHQVAKRRLLDLQEPPPIGPDGDELVRVSDEALDQKPASASQSRLAVADVALLVGKFVDAAADNPTLRRRNALWWLQNKWTGVPQKVLAEAAGVGVPAVSQAITAFERDLIDWHQGQEDDDA